MRYFPKYRTGFRTAWISGLATVGLSFTGSVILLTVTQSLNTEPFLIAALVSIILGAVNFIVFNRMLKGLKELSDTRMRIEEKLIKTEESLKYRTALADKSRIIEKMNGELADAFNNAALLYDVSQHLSTVLDLKDLVANIRTVFEERFRCDQLALYFTADLDDDLQLACSKGIAAGRAGVGQKVRPGEGIVGLVAERGRVFHAESFDAASPAEIRLTELEKYLHGSVFAAPLMARDRLIGVILVSRVATGAFTPTDRQAMKCIASQIAVTHDRCQLYMRTKELSIRDELTGLYNRRHFQHLLEVELKRAERHDRHVVFLMIDVDHFKKFNDTYGHLKGDDMLRAMARVLKRNLREADVIARFGGEEFVVMLTDTTLTDGIRVADKLRELVRLKLRHQPLLALAGPAELDANTITISIGVSAYPDCALTPEELVNSADMALYTAKHKGRDRIESYQTDRLPLDDFMNRMLVPGH